MGPRRGGRTGMGARQAAGRALKEAQMFPEDFDGIIAGAPGQRTAMGLWIAHALLKDPASYIPPAKYPLLHETALAACDARDGLEDGPLQIRRLPHRRSGRGGAQGLRSRPEPAHGQGFVGSLAPGSELGWAVMGVGPEPYAPILDQAKYVVFQDPKWDWRAFDFDKDNDRFERPEFLIMNSTDPHIEKFVARGKLLLYHGWADQNVSPYNTVEYFERVRGHWGRRRRTAACVSSWRPVWGAAAEARGPTRSTRSPSWTAGWKRARRGRTSSRRTARRKRSIGPAALPVSAGGCLSGLRKYRRRGEFRLPGAVAAACIADPQPATLYVDHGGPGTRNESGVGGKALGGARHRTGARSEREGDGYLHGNGYVVTWAIGHLVALAQPHEIHPEWKQWRRQLLPMLPAGVAAGGLREDQAPVRDGPEDPEFARRSAASCAPPTLGGKAS